MSLDLERMVAMTAARRDEVRIKRTVSGGSSRILSIAFRALSLAASAF